MRRIALLLAVLSLISCADDVLPEETPSIELGSIAPAPLQLFRLSLFHHS